jgi:ADP-dependent phosphofructokinase/glucokinase
MLYIVAICFAKLSVLLLYLRFFQVIDFTRHLIWFGLFFTILSSLGFMGNEIAQAINCMGIEALTNKFCQAVNKVVVIQAAANVITDFYILVIPLQQVYKLNMDVRKKLGVAAVFGVGFA